MVLGVSPCVSMVLPQLDVSHACCCALQRCISGDDYFVPGFHSSAMCPLSSIGFHALVGHSLLAYPKSQVHVNCLLCVGLSTLYLSQLQCVSCCEYCHHVLVDPKKMVWAAHPDPTPAKE